MELARPSNAAQLRSRPLSGGMGLPKPLRFLPLILAVGGCASFRSPRPQVAPLTPALRRVFGCYTISFTSPSVAGDPWEPFRAGPWRIRLDSTLEFQDTTERRATFLAPKVKWP